MEHLGLPHTAGIYNSASSALSAGASQATQIASDVEEAVTDAFYATIDSPRLAYDYVHGALDGVSSHFYLIGLFSDFSIEQTRKTTCILRGTSSFFLHALS